MPSLQRHRAIRITIAAAIALVALIVGTLFAYIFETAGVRDRIAMEYEASRAASLVFEAYESAGTVDGNMLPETVRGFGVYNRSGAAIYRHGTAPGVLAPEHHLLEITGKARMRGEVMRIVQPVGTFEVLRAMPEGTEELGSDSSPPGWRAPDLHNVPQAVLLDYDVSAHMQRATIRTYAWVGALLVVALLAALLFTLSRRLRRYEDEHERRNRLVQLGHAARTLTHEIKNPLGAIKLQVGVLKRELGDRDTQTLQVLDEELNRINNLVERVRDFLHASPGSPEQVDLDRLVRELPERFSFSVEVTSPEKPVVVYVDPERMQSVLTNVVQNAHESMEETAPDTPVQVTLSERKHETTLDIDDRGPGIPAEERERIFDPFYTTKPQGSGVGLAISKQFVEKMGGTLEVLDNPDGGTRIRIRLHS